MVKGDRSFPAPESLAEEAKKVTGRYDRQDVIERLKKDFHNKCYICEMKELQKRTALLITETFSMKNTGMRTYTSNERLRLLQKEMDVLYKQLEKIHNMPDSKVIRRTIRSLLRRESAFAAFKRCYVREHAAEYPELQQYVESDS